MKHLFKNTWHILFFSFILLVFVSSCKKKYDYHIKGVIVKATTQEPLKGVIIEVRREVGSGGTIFNPEFKTTELYQATTNEKGEFEMAFTSEIATLKIKFIKEFMRIFNSGLEGPFIDSGTSILNEISMSAEAEEFSIEFEPSLPNVQEVTLGFEWNYFPRGIHENIIWGTFPSYFTIFDNPRRPTSLERFGEQWLKMNFDMLLEDGSRLQKTDSIWLPGRYYDFNDYDFGDPRKYPVYKFTY